MDILSSGQFAPLMHLPQIAVTEANPRWPQQASKPQLGTRVRIGRVLNVQKRVAHEIAVPGNKAGRQRFLLSQIAGVPKLISAGIGEWVLLAVAIRLANAGRQSSLRIGAALDAGLAIGLAMGRHLFVPLVLTTLQ
jgi:hypothetical protein